MQSQHSNKRSVSCRAVASFVDAAEQNHIPIECLLKNQPYSLQHLRRPFESISWDATAQILRNAAELWSCEKLAELGGKSITSKMFTPFFLIARMLYSVHDFYLWLGSSNGPQMVDSVSASSRSVSPDEVEMTLMVRDGYQMCREFFWVTLGGMRNMPTFMGFKPAEISMDLLPRGAVYHIKCPPGGGMLAWLRRAIMWPFTLMAVGRELKNAHQILVQRYQELDSARLLLEHQATQLRTAYRISEVIHGDLDIQRILETITSSLVDVGSFAGASIAVNANFDGKDDHFQASSGTTQLWADYLVFELRGRKRTLGELRAWVPQPDLRPAATDLLETLLPSICMAIDDAITHTAVLHYHETLEMKVAERTANLLQTRDHLNATVTRLEAAQSARDQLFANINHEIRTPLSVILLAIGGIKHREQVHISDRSHSDLSTMERQVHKLLSLIDNLLLLAAAQEGKISLKIEQHEVVERLQSVVQAWSVVGEQARLSVQLHAPQTLYADVDLDAFERILNNLLSNAVKFTPPGGSIDVSVENADDYYFLRVADTGSGIDPEYRRRMFQRFEQGKAAAAHTHVRGSGIGLSIVRELVVAHQGDISALDRDGGGTVFVLKLPYKHTPIADCDSDAPHNFATALGRSKMAEVDLTYTPWPEDIAVPVMSFPSQPAEATILLAEDNYDLAMHIAALLADRYRVIVAPDGAKAMELAKQYLPDMLITDIGMPSKDGFALAEEFCRLEGKRLAPVLFLTAFGSPPTRVKGLETGAVDFITKPFVPAELLARISAQLTLRKLALRLHESEKLVALGLMSAGLAHELRNPANAVVNAVQPLKNLLPTEYLQAETGSALLLEVIEGGAMQLRSLATQLLGFIRPGEIQCSLEPIESLLNRALSLVGESLRGIEVRTSFHYTGPIYCAGALLVQVLANLLENAGHAAGSGGFINISTSLSHNYTVIEISDSGPGVAPQIRQNIFDPFFTTKAPGRGTGLGLPTARAIVEKHRGTLVMRDGPQGATFRMELPLNPSS